MHVYLTPLTTAVELILVQGVPTLGAGEAILIWAEATPEGKVAKRNPINTRPRKFLAGVTRRFCLTKAVPF